MSITYEQAAGMQARVNAHKTPHSERATKTATSVGAKAERAGEAARAQPVGVDSYIGIDPGTNTGFCEIIGGQIAFIETLTIWEALNKVKHSAHFFSGAVFVRFEDARLRKWFGKSGPEKWKGAGSIMRDCAIWEETLTDLGIPFEKVPPKEVKETTAEYFKKLTGWTGRTSIHAREAAWLILPYLKQK